MHQEKKKVRGLTRQGQFLKENIEDLGKNHIFSFQLKNFWVKEYNLDKIQFEVSEEEMDVLDTLDDNNSKAKDREAEIEQKIVKDLKEIRLNDFKSHDPIIQ